MGFQKITESCYYYPGAINVGLIVNDGQGVLIDTGMDKDAARKISKGMDSLGVIPAAIINTHAHADHCGGNAAFKKKYPEIKIYATPLEAALIEQPYYESFYLFAGGEPPLEMQNKFLKAEPSQVDERIEAGEFNVAGLCLELVSLPGHTEGQIGIKYQDVFFTADAFFGKNIVHKYGVPYFTNISATIKTLNLLESYEGTVVPCHGEIGTNFKEDIAVNLAAIGGTKNLLLKSLAQPQTESELVKVLADYCNIELKALGQYGLTRATLMAYLSYLFTSGEIKYIMRDNELRWVVS